MKNKAAWKRSVNFTRWWNYFPLFSRLRDRDRGIWRSISGFGTRIFFSTTYSPLSPFYVYRLLICIYTHYRLANSLFLPLGSRLKIWEIARKSSKFAALVLTLLLISFMWIVNIFNFIRRTNVNFQLYSSIIFYVSLVLFYNLYFTRTKYFLLYAMYNVIIIIYKLLFYVQ